ncbi:hypothetical protein Tco_0461683 [Tanacetum coccineum]
MPPASSLPPFMVCGVVGRLVPLLSLVNQEEEEAEFRLSVPWHGDLIVASMAGRIPFVNAFLMLLIIEYLVNISKRRAFWSLNEDILNITILKTKRCIHQGRYGVSVPAFTKDHKGIKLNTPYPEDQYAVLEIWNEYNILEDIKRGPYSKKSLIRRIQSLDTPYQTDFQTL